MNRRGFIKLTVPTAALAAWIVACKNEEPEQDPKGHKGETGEIGCNWNYRVCCYERGQGEWCFSENARGSFDRSKPLKSEFDAVYSGFMQGGKLFFPTLEAAQDFVDCHVRVKDDTNLIDSIYDIYYLNSENKEIQVSHYWFNKDTGRQVHWENSSLVLLNA